MHELSESAYAAIGRVALAAANLEWQLAICSRWLADGEMISGVTLKAAQRLVQTPGEALRAFTTSASHESLAPVAAESKALLRERNTLIHSLAWRPLAADGHEPEPVRLFPFRSEPMAGEVPDADVIAELAARMLDACLDAYQKTKAVVESRVPPPCPDGDA